MLQYQNRESGDQGSVLVRGIHHGHPLGRPYSNFSLTYRTEFGPGLHQSCGLFADMRQTKQ
eukprot:1133691-Pelagomonas_calceolata.AAC.2